MQVWHTKRWTPSLRVCEHLTPHYVDAFVVGGLQVLCSGAVWMLGRTIRLRRGIGIYVQIIHDAP